jgi:two-component system, NarL family, nitrate/nitrite response regulator NarL
MDACPEEDSGSAIRALIASGVRLYRESLEQVLRNSNGIAVIGGASSADETLDQARERRPTVLLLDMAMDDAFSVAKQIARHSRLTKVVALGMPERESEVLSCAVAGIAGYVTRSASANDVLETVQAAARGEVRCSPKVAGFLFRHIATLAGERGSATPATSLTAREAQIRRLLREGMSNKMISRTLGIELPTVKNHVHSILGKLGVHRRAEVILLFSEEPRGSEGQSKEP